MVEMFKVVAVWVVQVVVAMVAVEAQIDMAVMAVPMQAAWPVMHTAGEAMWTVGVLPTVTRRLLQRVTSSARGGGCTETSGPPR